LRGLAGTVAGGGGAVDLRAGIFVVVEDKFRPGAELGLGEGGEGNTLALVVAHIEQPDIFGTRTVNGLRLNVNLPLAAEAIKIIDEIAAHKSLHGAVNI